MSYPYVLDEGSASPPPWTEWTYDIQPLSGFAQARSPRAQFFTGRLPIIPGPTVAFPWSPVPVTSAGFKRYAPPGTFDQPDYTNVREYRKRRKNGRHIAR